MYQVKCKVMYHSDDAHMILPSEVTLQYYYSAIWYRTLNIRENSLKSFLKIVSVIERFVDTLNLTFSLPSTKFSADFRF